MNQPNVIGTIESYEILSNGQATTLRLVSMWHEARIAPYIEALVLERRETDAMGVERWVAVDDDAAARKALCQWLADVMKPERQQATHWCGGLVASAGLQSDCHKCLREAGAMPEPVAAE